MDDITSHFLFDVIKQIYRVIYNTDAISSPDDFIFEALNTLSFCRLAFKGYLEHKRISYPRNLELDQYMEALSYCSAKRMIEILDTHGFETSLSSCLVQYQQDCLQDLSSQPLKSFKDHHPPEVINILQTWFMSNVSDPYPSKDEVRKISLQTGLSNEQIRTWFANARKRQRIAE